MYALILLSIILLQLCCQALYVRRWQDAKVLPCQLESDNVLALRILTTSIEYWLSESDFMGSQRFQPFHHFPKTSFTLHVQYAMLKINVRANLTPYHKI